MRVTLLVIVCLVSLCINAAAQGAFEDSEGKSGIVLNTGGAGIINITNGSAKIAYVYINTTSHWRFGAEIQGSLTKGIGSLFVEKSVAAQAGGKATIGYQHLLSEKPTPGSTPVFFKDDWLYMQLGFSRASNALFDREVNAITKRPFDGYSAMLYYNVLISNGSFLIGVAAGFDRQNNSTELTPVEIIDGTPVVSGRTLTSSTDALEGDYKESNHLVANADIVWLPNFLGNRIGVDLFGRFDANATEKSSTFKPGFGLFINEAGNPTHVIGGISFESVSGKLRVGIMGGFHF